MARATPSCPRAGSTTSSTAPSSSSTAGTAPARRPRARPSCVRCTTASRTARSATFRRASSRLSSPDSIRCPRRTRRSSGSVLLLDTLDQTKILDFYNQWAERTNPEKQCAVPSASPTRARHRPRPPHRRRPERHPGSHRRPERRRTDHPAETAAPSASDRGDPHMRLVSLSGEEDGGTGLPSTTGDPAVRRLPDGDDLDLDSLTTSAVGRRRSRAPPGSPRRRRVVARSPSPGRSSASAQLQRPRRRAEGCRATKPCCFEVRQRRHRR
jgi:hypothetical protein